MECFMTLSHGNAGTISLIEFGQVIGRDADVSFPAGVRFLIKDRVGQGAGSRI